MREKIRTVAVIRRPKPARFRQKTPRDQLIAIRSSLEGHLGNYQDGTIEARDLAHHLVDHIADLEELERFVRGGWNDR